jgi:hypothetical protein
VSRSRRVNSHKGEYCDQAECEYTTSMLNPHIKIFLLRELQVSTHGLLSNLTLANRFTKHRSKAMDSNIALCSVLSLGESINSPVDGDLNYSANYYEALIATNTQEMSRLEDLALLYTYIHIYVYIPGIGTHSPSMLLGEGGAKAAHRAQVQEREMGHRTGVKEEPPSNLDDILEYRRYTIKTSYLYI